MKEINEEENKWRFCHSTFEQELGILKEITEEENTRRCHQYTFEQESTGELFGDGVWGGVVTPPAPPFSTAGL
jgi:hypothetical protein